MCRNGINLTQFKLSIHQLSRFSKTLEDSIKQWEDLTNSLGLSALSAELQNAGNELKNLQSRLEAIISLADEAEASDDGVSITPI